MILANGGSGNLVESKGAGGTSSVSIANSPHMFTILSSGLYSDKIAAVLREIGCNAMDAHIMSEQPQRPFQVKLPTALDRSFYIKDWGPGLDDHEFRELYTTYGWSNKQQRSDATGAFGLGSKSPFAYTLQNIEESTGYTVETVKNGSRRVYSCYIGDNGTPQVTQLYEGPAEPEWQHGVKVSFPVRKDDVDEFQTKATQVFRWFTVKPEVLGLASELLEPKFSTRGTFFGLSEDAGLSCAVVMGNVRYPLRIERLKGLHAVERNLANTVTLFLPLGSVMMTPAREELEYTENARAVIIEKLSAAAKEVAGSIRNAVMEKEDTQWAWARKVQNLYRSLPLTLRNIKFSSLLDYAGVSAEDANLIETFVGDSRASMPRWVGDGPQESTTETGCRLFYLDKTASGLRRREVIGGFTPHKNKDGQHIRMSFNYANDAEVYILDSPLADKRLRNHATENAKTTVMFLVPYKGAPEGCVEEYAKRMVACPELDGVKVRRTSELDLPQSYLDARKREAEHRAELKRQTPRQLMAKNVVKVVDFQSGETSPMFLGELPDSGLFYVLCSRQEVSNYKAIISSPNNREVHNRRGYAYKTLSEVALSLGVPNKGIVVVKHMAAVRRLKLEEQGFVPYLDHLAKVAGSSERFKRLFKVRSMKLRESDLDNAGWLGNMQKMAAHRAFWHELSKNPLAHPMQMNVLEASSVYGTMSEKDHLACEALRKGFSTFMPDVGVALQGESPSAHQQGHIFLAQFPYFEFVSSTRLARMVVEQPTRAAKLLSMVITEHVESTGDAEFQQPGPEDEVAQPDWRQQVESIDIDPEVEALLNIAA